MRYSLYLFAILLIYISLLNNTLSDPCNRVYTFDSNSDNKGWEGLESMASPDCAPIIQPNKEIDIKVKNCKDYSGTIKFNYSITGDFIFNCKLIFSIDNITHNLTSTGTEVSSEPYAVNINKNKTHILKWNLSCSANSLKARNPPTCIIDNISFKDIEVLNQNEPESEELHLDPRDKDLNSKINQSDEKIIKLKKGLHFGPIFLGQEKAGITIEPEIDSESGKPVNVTFDANNASYAFKLSNTSDIKLGNLVLKNCSTGLMVENSSSITIDKLKIKNYTLIGILITNCQKSDINLISNKLMADQGKPGGIAIENSQKVIAYENKIELPKCNDTQYYSYYLENSSSNKIYLYAPCCISINGCKLDYNDGSGPNIMGNEISPIG